jgi:hypothetical protein
MTGPQAALIPNLRSQEETVSNASRASDARQAARSGAPRGDGRPLPLVRLFSLFHAGGGRISVASLAPLREIHAALHEHVASLRFAAEDATCAEPLMPPAAQHADVLQHGAAVEELLHALGLELDVLAQKVRDEEGAGHVS